jgi:hypothetical protein
MALNGQVRNQTQETTWWLALAPAMVFNLTPYDPNTRFPATVCLPEDIGETMGVGHGRLKPFMKIL